MGPRAASQTGELRAVLGQRPDADEQAVDLLELLPLLTPERLAAAPEPLLRALFERFQLQVRYHKPQNRATIRVALSDDSLDGLLASLGDIEGGAVQQDLPVSSAGAVSLVGGASRPESNRRPHPYHGSAVKRRATRRSRRSQRTVDAAVMCSAVSWLGLKSSSPRPPL
jgi:hypothetical protein